MKDSKIEWCDHTFNGWSGCTKVSPGCANCYAEKLARRTGTTLGQWGKGAPRRRTSAKYWAEPLKWNAAKPISDCAYDHNGDGDCHIHLNGCPTRRPRVFCASLADWLDDDVPVEWLADLLDLIRLTPNLDWLLLSKRPENWRKRMIAVLKMPEMTVTPETWGRINLWVNGEPLSNVWIGTSVEDQQRADERIPHLLEIPARVRFLSCEPLLGPVRFFPSDFNPRERKDGKIDWVIAGGESGPGARPMHQDWARGLRDQCQAAGVAFFMKQIGGTRKPFPEIPEDLLIREFPTI